MNRNAAVASVASVAAALLVGACGQATVDTVAPAARPHLDIAWTGNGTTGGLCNTFVTDDDKIDAPAGQQGWLFLLTKVGAGPWSLSATFDPAAPNSSPAAGVQQANGAVQFVVYSAADAKLLSANVSGGTTDQTVLTVSHCQKSAAIPLQPLTVSKTAAGAYTRTIKWTLDKTVDQATVSGVRYGPPVGPVTWTVTATKNATESNFSVVGQITVNNPNPVAVGVGVADQLNDATAGAVDCDALTPGDQSTGTVPANGSLVCNYTAAPTGRTASKNVATVTVDQSSYTVPAGYTGQILGGSASVPFSWTETVVGDESTTLGDVRFTYSQSISASSSQTFQESFTCPTDRSAYTNGAYTTSYTNTATLTGATTNLSDDATVTLNCRNPYVVESATGAGFPWSATSGAPRGTWFMYSPWLTTGSFAGLNPGPVNLIAGQVYDAGDITAVGPDGSRKITITLQNGAIFTAPGNNVFIQPLSSCTAGALSYVQPGQFSIKLSLAALAGTTGPLSVPDAACYGIHVSVERYVP